jgi:hypothetical protein
MKDFSSCIFIILGIYGPASSSSLGISIFNSALIKQGVGGQSTGKGGGAGTLAGLENAIKAFDIP